MLCAFFWVIPRRLNFIHRRFGTLCSMFIGGYLPAYEHGTECSETSVYKNQTPGNYPEGSIHSQNTVLSSKPRIGFTCLKVRRFSHLLLGYRQSESRFKSSRRAPVHAKKEKHPHTHTHVVTLL